MKRFPKIIISICITIILFLLLFSQITFAALWTTLTSIPLSLIMLGGVAYVLAAIFRALRFRYLMIDNVIPLRALASIAFIHLFLINVLPLRSGELSFIYLLKKQGIPASNSTAILATARVYDLLTVLLIGIVAIIISGLAAYFSILILIILILFLLIILVFWFSLSRDHVARKFRMLLISLLGNWLGKKLKKTLWYFQLIHKQKRVFVIAFYSIMIWTSSILVYIFLLTNLISSLSLSNMVVGGTMNIVLNTIPINGIVGFGTVEGIWSAVFYLLGVAKEIAITSGFSFHIIKILYVGIIGMVGLALVKK